MKAVKTLLWAFLLIFLSQITYAQTYLISDESIETCGGTLYDTGGASGQYGNNESYTLVLCSDNGSTIELQFTSFNLASGDLLDIYNGAGITNLLVSGTGSSLNGQTVISNVDCLTLVWSTNASGTAAGFAANIICSTLCQGYTTAITSNPAITDPINGYLDICPGTTVNFTAVSDFFNNGSEGYTQSTASTNYTWQLIDEFSQIIENQTGLGLINLSHTFNESAGYTLTLNSEDIEGCWNMGDATIRIRVSVPPTFTGTSLNPDPICPGELVTLTGQVQTYPWQMSVVDIAIVEQCLDDHYNDVIPFEVNTFAPGQTITSANDIEAICVNMEHSYIGDFYLYIECPNGQQTMLHEYYSCNNSYFGLPNHSDNCSPGTGWDYCWSMSAAQAVTSVCTSGQSVPAGTYLPIGGNSFASLIGCPVNGEWKIRFNDNWGQDDGYIWTANLVFSPAIMPQDTWGYENEYDTGANSTGGSWSGPDMDDDIGFIGTAHPTVSGDINYTFTAIDDFGCEYDTTINVTVKPITDPTCCIMPVVNAGNDDAVCALTYDLSSSLTTGNSGIWTVTAGPPGAVFTNETNPNTTVTVNIYGTYEFAYTEYYQGNTDNTVCSDSDTVEITFNETFDPTISPIDDMCISASAFQIQTVNFGVLTCTPPTTALNATTGIFTPQNADPGTYTITNTLTGPCTGPGTYSETFEIFDEISIMNFSETCTEPAATRYIIVEWDVESYNGTLTNDYLVNGMGQTGSHFSETIESPDSYAYTITDLNGCSEHLISGYRDCGCELFAGTMGSLQTIILCQDECTAPAVTHNGDQASAGGIFEFMIHTGNNTPLAYNSTPNFCLSDFGGMYNTIYYVSAICGYDLGGHPNLTHSCRSIAQGTPVMWQENPIAHAGSDKDTCGLVMRLNGNAPTGDMYGYWSSDCEFFAVGGTSYTQPNPIVMATDYNTCTFTWNIVNGECTDSDDVTIGFLQTPRPDAGPDITVCGNEATMNATPSIGFSTLSWSGNGTNFNPQNSATAIAQVSNFGTYQYTVTEDNGSCTGTDKVLVTYVQNPSPTTTPNADSVCGTTHTLQVLNSHHPGIWTAYENGNPAPGVTYTPSNTSTTVEVTIGNYPGFFREIEFVWTETNQVSGVPCSGSATKVVIFAKKPIASVGPIDESEICGNCNPFNADTTGSGWASGSWVNAKGLHGEWDNAQLPSATFCIDSVSNYGDTAHVRAPFLWIMNNYGCTSVDTAWVTFYQRPEANAGLDRTVCGKVHELGAVYDISETTNYTPSGTWSVYEKPLPAAQANIQPQENDTAMCTVSHNGIYQFVFRENNSNLTMCYDTDTVQIEFVEVPIISAGEDKDVCGTCTTMGATSGGFEGSWLANGSAYDDYNDPNTNVCQNGYGPIEYVWLESNQAITDPTFSCSSKDTVVITYWRIPTANIMTDTADSTTCGLTFDRLRAENPGTGISGSWYTNNPATDFGDEFSVNTWARVPSYGYHNFYWVEENGPSYSPGFCTDTAGPLRIHFIEIPEANAGHDTIFCGYTGSLNALPSVGNGVWSTPSVSNITFDDENDPYTGITSTIINTGNPSNPYFNIFWTEDNTNGCTDRDTIKVIFARIPKSNINIIPPKCFGEPASIAAEEDSLQQYTWNFYTGAIDSTSINPLGGEYENFVYWNSSDTLHRISLITTNHWNCQSTITIDTVYEPAIPEFDVTIVSDTCMLGKGGLIFEDTLANSSFFWLDTVYGPPTGPVTTVYNLPTGEYNIRTSYQTPNMTYYSYYLNTFNSANCIDTIPYTIEPIGMIEAIIEIATTTDMTELVAPEATVFFLNNSIYDNVSKRCEWHFGDGETLKNCDPQVEHIYTEAGCFDPFLIVMNRDLMECRDTAYLETCIPVDNASKLEVPNIFSPNGDGYNDFFQVKAQTLRTFSGIIVNRYGRTVYEWENWQDYEAGWDGKLSGGTKATPGVYYFIIKAVGMDDQEHNIQGPLHLMRD